MRKGRWIVVGLIGVAVAAAVGCTEDAPATGDDRAAIIAGDRGLSIMSRWKYWDRGGDLGSAWRAPAFDDSGWSDGRGKLGYGETYLQTTIGYGPSSSSKYLTTYFRTQFTLGDPAAVTKMTAFLMYDDGVVIYLNGHEVGRQLVPAGQTAATPASSGHEAADTYERYDWTAQLPNLVEGVNTLAVEVHQQTASSGDLVFDLGVQLEFAVAPTPTAGGIPHQSTWRYWDRGGDLGSGWRALAFDDDGWAYNRGPLGYGESYLASVVGYGPSASSKYLTTYFRADFTVDDPAAVTAMTGDLMYDDGLVVYLNGHEIGRQGVAAGQTASTAASGHEAGNAYETFDWTAQRSHLVAGVNTIAVEVHQQSASSSDLVFDLGLNLTVMPPTSGDIARGSTWTYWDRGGDLGSAWRARTFNDAAWPRGPGALGYGESYLATTIGYGGDASHKYITSYFRRAFSIANPAAVTSLVAELMYDDGVVVYLNGTEVKRLHLPSGTITASTLAPGWETGNRYESYDLSAYRALLVAGTNVVAVEVHQAQPTSSDLTFDLALAVGTTCAIAPLGPLSGRAQDGHFGAGGGEDEYADVHWTLERTEGCVDHYRPSGTAHDVVGAHYCWDAEPSAAPIEPTDGELIIDRSTSPATYTVNGLSEWEGLEGCDDPNDSSYGMEPSTLRARWATNLRGSFDGAVISGGNIEVEAHPINWYFTRDEVAFPAPAAGTCVEPRSDRWATSVVANTGHADATWTWESTTGCVDHYTPSGTGRIEPKIDDSPFAFCRVRSYDPDSGPIDADDGDLYIDRSTNPPTFNIGGGARWIATERCERPDGSVQLQNDYFGVSLGMYEGAYQGNRFGGGFGAVMASNDWAFTRL
jgi:hypothetical protein